MLNSAADNYFNSFHYILWFRLEHCTYISNIVKFVSSYQLVSLTFSTLLNSTPHLHIDGWLYGFSSGLTRVWMAEELCFIYLHVHTHTYSLSRLIVRGVNEDFFLNKTIIFTHFNFFENKNEQNLNTLLCLGCIQNM